MNQFGGGSQFGGGGADDYGFFAPPRATGTSNQFGAAPVGTASPVGTFGGPLAPTDPPAAASGKAKAGRVLGVLALVVVLAVGAWFGWVRYQLSRPLTVPATLGALSAVTDTKVSLVKNQVESEWRQQYPDKPIALGVYAGHRQAIILALARGTSDAEQDFSDIGYTGALLPVGHAQCATVQAGLVACERTSRTLSAMVVVFGGTAQDAANALDEAWQQQ